jgi:hypothetical protein
MKETINERAAEAAVAAAAAAAATATEALRKFQHESNELSNKTFKN